MCFSHSLLILGPAFSAGTSFLEKIINVKLWECTHVWEVRKEDSMMHCLEWVRLDYSLEDTSVFSMSFQAHCNCRFALKETRVRICLWTVRASARQWKIASARCVVTEQQGFDVKIELIAAPAHLLTSAACSPPSRHFPSPRSSEGWLCNASLQLRWGQERHTPVVPEEKWLSRLTSHRCSHDILFPTNAAYSLLHVRWGLQNPEGWPFQWDWRDLCKEREVLWDHLTPKSGENSNDWYLCLSTVTVYFACVT